MEKTTTPSKQRQLLDRWNKAIGWLIPGGSEYIDGPERCTEAIKYRYDSDNKRTDILLAKQKEQALAKAKTH